MRIDMRMPTARAVCGSVAGCAAALALAVAGAPQAVAGGSTSVLVVAPESGQSTALHWSAGEYAELESALGHLGSDSGTDLGKGRRAQPPGLAMGDGRRQVTVTWMVHDVRPWRVDRAYPVASETGDGKGGGDGEGGKGGTNTDVLWIHTTTDVASMKGVWHKAKDPLRLTALFEKLGVLGPAKAEGGHAAPPEADSAPPSASGSEAASGRGDGAPGDGGTGWWWAIPGAAAGAVGALLLREPFAGRRPLLASLRGRRPHEDGPRQELRGL
ncbi:hypothetical protein ACWGII_18020 [Streptomyces sp. NPDC054855]